MTDYQRNFQRLLTVILSQPDNTLVIPQEAYLVDPNDWEITKIQDHARMSFVFKATYKPKGDNKDEDN
ncbi:hypothetical protein [Bacillus wiedmannii]|uniref:hypothetical protein n=1 Tax=Bacillus wiedmannii TaxID=1890302 RepID=UPI000BEFB4ED|nr:hypothetical protein [Bacillus wiedmannii]PEO38304.1 hypothetical protein CN555_13940 [Bacillus wiedmannii]